MTKDIKRHELIDQAKTMRSEIAQIFADAEHWNNTHTRFERIDPDPDGELSKLASRIDTMLESEHA